MSIYARIDNGVVAELFTPPPGTTIAECFNQALIWVDVTTVSPQPTVGWSATEANAAWTFTAPQSTPGLTPAQIAQAAYAELIAGGVTITSTGTPALSGVYAIDAQSQSDIATEAQFISTFSEFTNGTTTGLAWAQASGTFIAFPTTAEFLAFAKVVGELVAAAKLAAAQAASMPSAAATIP